MAQDSSPVVDYLIGRGYPTFSVWKDEASDRQCVVLPDGKDRLPLIGQIPAAVGPWPIFPKNWSRTRAFVSRSGLNVAVHQINSLIVYVIGRVNSPGRFVLNTDVNVLQALAMAGGLPLRQARGHQDFPGCGGGTKVTVLRLRPGGRRQGPPAEHQAQARRRDCGA